MNDFALVQLIWIKRLVSETSRVNTLIEIGKLSNDDLNRYKSIVSSLDEYCASVIDSQEWGDFENISKIVDDVEMILFMHFCEEIDAFADEKVSLDFSNEANGEVNLKFENPDIEDMCLNVIDEEDLNSIHTDSGAFAYYDPIVEPILEGNLVIPSGGLNLEEAGNPLDSIFDLKEGESIQVPLEELISFLDKNQDELKFHLDPEVCGIGVDEAEMVSFEEFLVHLIDNCSDDATDELYGIFNLGDDED